MLFPIVSRHMHRYIYIYIYICIRQVRGPKKDITPEVHKGLGPDGMGLELSTRCFGFRGKIEGFSEFAVSLEVGILDVVFYTCTRQYPCLLGLGGLQKGHN